MKRIIFLFITISTLAAPTPPSLEEIIQNSDYIAKTKLHKIKETKINKFIISINATAEIIKEYKAKSKMPDKLDLAFSVLPEFYGKWLKYVPKEQEYILFFIEKEIKNTKGESKKIITLYEPHIFAFREVELELENKLTKP